MISNVCTNHAWLLILSLKAHNIIDETGTSEGIPEYRQNNTYPMTISTHPISICVKNVWSDYVFYNLRYSQRLRFTNLIQEEWSEQVTSPDALALSPKKTFHWLAQYIDIFTKYRMAYTAWPDKRNKTNKLMKTTKTIRLHLNKGETETKRASKYA